jgi:hypothetical protein
MHVTVSLRWIHLKFIHIVYIYFINLFILPVRLCYFYAKRLLFSGYSFVIIGKSIELSSHGPRGEKGDFQQNLT